MASSNKKSWGELPIKDKLSYISAVGSLFVGFGLTIAGFVVSPLGEVSNSVLWVLGQTLAFAGAIFGIALYTKNEIASQLDERGYKQE